MAHSTDEIEIDIETLSISTFKEAQNYVYKKLGIRYLHIIQS